MDKSAPSVQDRGRAKSGFNEALETRQCPSFCRWHEDYDEHEHLGLGATELVIIYWEDSDSGDWCSALAETFPIF